jgi:hypothetical protein
MSSEMPANNRSSDGAVVRRGAVGRPVILNPLGQFDELCRASRRMALDSAPLRPRIGVVMMPDVTEQHARRGLVDNQPHICVDTHRPEIRVLCAVEPMEMQTGASRIELQVERRSLDRFLLRPGQSRETSREGIRNAEIHHCTENTFITSSPRWLMTLTAMRPDLGLGKGREVSLLRLDQASSSISGSPCRLQRLVGVHRGAEK